MYVFLYIYIYIYILTNNIYDYKSSLIDWLLSKILKISGQWVGPVMQLYLADFSRERSTNCVLQAFPELKFTDIKIQSGL